jgi:uncharacterized protein YndB with AHSA1/START domain
MTVTSIDKDLDRLTLTLVADLDAPIDRVWDLWADPRLLERWWGPPTYPATFETHELRAGGRATYYMTGPDGDRPRGWWQFLSVDAPRSLEFSDGFANDDGTPNPDMPVSRAHVELTEQDGHARMEMRFRFASREQMEQVLDMGTAEGLREAVGQMDTLLVERFGARV